MAMQIQPSGKIDRQTTVPFHLKLFYKKSSHYRPDEFPTSASQSLPPHLQIYTWLSCSIRELSHLLTSALPALLPDPVVGTRLSYRLVFPDTRDAGRGGVPRYITKELGSIVVGDDLAGRGAPPDEDTAGIVGTEGPMTGRLEGEPERTLQDARFVIGDYVTCAIFAPGENGEVAPPSAGRGFRDRMGGPPFDRGGRENGFGGGGGYRGRGRGSSNYGRLNDGGAGLPHGEWRRGERLPEGPGGDRGYGRARDGRW